MLAFSEYGSGMDETMTLTLNASRVDDARRLALRMWANATPGLRFDANDRIVRLTATTPHAMRALATVPDGR